MNSGNKIKRWMRMVGLSFVICHLSFSVCACSEASGEEEEYPNWQETNESYFLEKYNEYAYSSYGGRFALAKTSAVGTPVAGTVFSPTDYVLVEVLESGSGTVSPEYTDTVTIHYTGTLLPSRSYSSGYRFDYSYDGDFDPVVATPKQFAVGGTNGVITGFATALQHMHRGDHWRVTVPHQLGYGENGSGTAIPGYSTLIFDIRLVDFWFKEEGDRE